MSKAFTRESDETPELPLARQRSALPLGAKNYLTPQGADRLHAELDRLVQVERPRLVTATADLDAKRQLQMLDQRIQHLQQCLFSAVVVPPPASPGEQVRFGATVSVRTSLGQFEGYRIVGVDEIDIDQGWVSWISPIAKALLNTRIGERVRFKFPSGEVELEIVGIRYE